MDVFGFDDGGDAIAAAIARCDDVCRGWDDNTFDLEIVKLSMKLPGDTRPTRALGPHLRLHLSLTTVSYCKQENEIAIMSFHYHYQVSASRPSEET